MIPCGCIGRRSALLGALATLATSRIGWAAPLDIETAGCFLTSDKSADTIRQQVLDTQANPRPQSTGDDRFDYALGIALNEMAELFRIRPAFLFWDQPGLNTGGYATAKTYLPGTQGTVYLGRALFQTEVAKSPHGHMAVLGVCAHEFAHIVQYHAKAHERLLAGERTKRRMELHADFLAGFYFGHRKFDYGAEQRGHLVAAFEALGDTNLNDPEHHGTPDERIAALDSGFRMGRASGRGVAEAIEAGYYYLGA